MPFTLVATMTLKAITIGYFLMVILASGKG